MIGRRGGRQRGRTKRRRFRFSLNGLAIQLSALALSFTLVALLVVSGSHSAFVQQNETVAKAQALAKLRQQTSDSPDVPSGRTFPAARPSPSAAPAPAVSTPVVASPVPTPTTPTVVQLSDSAAGTAMFGNETLIPGTPLERCIDVTYSGNAVAGPVVLYAAPTSGDLAPYLDMTIDIGPADPASGGSCQGFQPTATLFQGTLADFATTRSSYATGQPTWTPSATASTRRFRFTLTVRDDDAASGRTAGFGFSWLTEAP